ncbi:FAD-dependent oxidoreductase [uncultured Bacteroides sp.]|uniref:FAD-dependent oxidoreductase n=1 Tax=uncultured Bacteroides sp. TaxID=162156 RepID=UPI0027DAD9DD|nr:FAD-dependent oxidoreductase [uncultured Bacteroides sp.]
MKVIIIGGVAGGATTAARIRRVDESAEIILLEKGKYISYANCGLPYYIGGVIEERDKLFVQTPEAFSTRFRVDVRTENEVIFIDRKRKTVTVRQSSEDTYEESYDKLLISTGASPVRPPLPGIDLSGIFTLRNVADTDKIKAYIDSHAPRQAVVVGAGFIGLEMAENLHAQGAKVSIVEMGNQVMTPIDFSMASLVHQHLMDKGVNLYLEQAVASFERDGKGLKVTFKNGQSIAADIVILSIGVRPETNLARAAGLTVGPAGGIAVNDYLQTSDESIYAIGDAIEYRHPITGKPWLNYLAGPANRQGRIAADNILGAKIAYEGSIGTSIAKVFDMTVASTGLPGKRLRVEGIDYMSSTIHPSSHAGYYPDAMPMSIKITFDKQTGRLYGGQIVGYDGVDKRIDELALVIKHEGTIYDLMKVEQAYAPPFSSAKDPVALAGYVAEDIIIGKTNPIYWRELRDIEMENKFLLDVRTPDEFALGTLPGAVNIPLDELRDRLTELPKDRMIYTFCAVGLRGYLAYRILTQHGFEKVRNLSGGLKTYRAATAPIIIHEDNDSEIEEMPIQQKGAASAAPIAAAKTIRVDACGLQCPGPILKMKKTMDGLASGERVEITATDPGFPRDAAAWCSSTGNQLVSKEASGGKSVVIIEKGEPKSCNIVTSCEGKGKTFIMFSDDLDKALATFVLANGAAATGQKVTIFFTFWGLNVIKKLHKPKAEKDIFGKMFGMMLPSSSKKLKLSKMSMGGIGGKMMRYIMKEKGIDSLESLRQQALENGVEFIACQMSMDVMGVKQEELLDEVTIGGVATYMERADNANVNLFI